MLNTMLPSAFVHGGEAMQILSFPRQPLQEFWKHCVMRACQMPCFMHAHAHVQDNTIPRAKWEVGLRGWLLKAAALNWTYISTVVLSTGICHDREQHADAIGPETTHTLHHRENA